MMDSMIIGKYVPGTSFVHRLDQGQSCYQFSFVFIVFLRITTSLTGF